NARLGVMIRSGEDGTRPDAAQVHMVLRPKQDGRASFCVRITRGQDSTEDERPAKPFGWVRLVRQDDAVTGYISADGVKWNNQGKAALPPGKDVLLGLCLSSDSDAVATVTFDQVVITGTPTKDADAAPWPVVTDDLTFAWRQVGVKLGLPGADAWRVEPHGRAIWGADRAMSTAGGWFDLPRAGETLATAARASNAVTVEALITTDRLGQSGARILTAGNIRLAQEDSRLLVSLRTAANPDGTPWVDVCSLVAGVPHHIVISYKPGRLTGYLDGVQKLDSDRVTGDLANWIAQPLRVGRELNGQNIWDGHLAYLSLYATSLDAAAVARKYAAVKVGLAQRSAVSRLVVEAQLVAAADPPVIATMAPYRRALQVHIYTVNRVESGVEPAPRIAVAHWCVLDGAALPVRKLGLQTRLTLERFSDHPELEGELRTDDPAYGDLPLYYDDTH
ncbi:MAG: LamG-like jellyroll fold domain-containing protein, partial [bacterium]